LLRYTLHYSSPHRSYTFVCDRYHPIAFYLLRVRIRLDTILPHHTASFTRSYTRFHAARTRLRLRYVPRCSLVAHTLRSLRFARLLRSHSVTMPAVVRYLLRCLPLPPRSHYSSRLHAPTYCHSLRFARTRLRTAFTHTAHRTLSRSPGLHRACTALPGFWICVTHGFCVPLPGYVYVRSLFWVFTFYICVHYVLCRSLHLDYAHRAPVTAPHLYHLRLPGSADSCLPLLRRLVPRCSGRSCCVFTLPRVDFTTRILHTGLPHGSDFGLRRMPPATDSTWFCWVTWVLHSCRLPALHAHARYVHATVAHGFSPACHHRILPRLHDAFCSLTLRFARYAIFTWFPMMLRTFYAFVCTFTHVCLVPVTAHTRCLPLILYVLTRYVWLRAFCSPR